MPPALAFFPWVAIEDKVEIGPIRLLPYESGRLPGDLPNMTQADIDGVLSAYANRPGVTVKQATILEVGKWVTGTEVQDVVSALFRAREAIAFAALSKRELFRQFFGYSNNDTYALVVQRYSPGNTGTFAFTTRRRDGVMSHGWSSDYFAFHRPDHVDTGARFSVDKALLSSILAIPDSRPWLFEAVREYNCANTDSRDVPPHVEIVMLKSAFEWLLCINEKAATFVNALTTCLREIPALESMTGPLKSKWEAARSHAKRPLEAWAKEFCAVRGASAHGRRREVEHFVWDEQTHLAFASVLFPLIFKSVIADMGLFKLGAYDIERLRRIDAYIEHDPFDFDWMAPKATHPWVNIDDISRIYAEVDLSHFE